MLIPDIEIHLERGRKSPPKEHPHKMGEPHGPLGEHHKGRPPGGYKGGPPPGGKH